MIYITRTATGSSGEELRPMMPVSKQISNRTGEVTAGIAAGQTQYGFREVTDDTFTHEPLSVQPVGEKISKTKRSPRIKKPVFVAEREHLARLLRECQRISHELADSDDPIDSALLGGELTNQLHELWRYRRCRESDWVEILNMVQIAIPAEEFEFLSKAKRLAIVNVFNDALMTRTVGPAELDRCLRILSEAGFNVWAGLSDDG